MAVLDTLVAVIPMLGILIVVHELGHFLVAKACGVRVLKFSIGFGAPIGFGKLRLRWERGGTEYVIGWIPLGGFVRMLGEPMPGDEGLSPPIPDDVREDEFLENKPVWQRLAVVFAGPAMNLFLPVVCLLGILWNGVERMDAVVGMVEQGAPAAVAGIQPGDRILSVAGDPITYFSEAIEPIREAAPGRVLTLEVERGGEHFGVEVPVGVKKVRSPFGTFEDVGWVGIVNERLDALVGVPSLESPAGRVGLQTGDRVVAVGGVEVEGWEALRAAQARSASAEAGPEVVWRVSRSSPRVDASPDDAPVESELLSFTVPSARRLEALGVVPATILVASVAADRPAAQAGLLPGDLVVAVDGEPVGSFGSFVSRIQTSAGREMALTYARDGRLRTTPLRAREEVVAGRYDIEGMEERIYQIGLSPERTWLPGARVAQRVRNPLEALPQAVAMTWDMTGRYLEGLSRLVSGGMGADKLSGPIGIARIARKSLDRGFEEYLWMMMLISINLGVLNLLPIPILDGGQALIYAIEGIKRSPLSLRSREIASSMGFAFLVLLMGRAFWNDLTPFWTRFVEWMSQGAP
jgi:regulator of sigma E protease